MPLNMAKYLPWRVRLYSAVCLAYEEAKMNAEALQFAERGLAQVTLTLTQTLTHTRAHSGGSRFASSRRWRASTPCPPPRR